MNNSEAIKLIFGWIGFVSITGLFVGFWMSVGWHLAKR